MASNNNKNKLNTCESSSSSNKKMKMELLNANDLQLSPPSIHQDDTDESLSSLIGQHNLIISYHMNEMVLTLEESWRKKLAIEIRKRKEMEEEIKLKDELMHFYKEMIFLLEEMVQGRCIDADVLLPDEEDDGSSLVNNHGDGLNQFEFIKK
ncbi:hypothetical protein L2E82_05464 [Cichorium intybus]|uniref:Uncharacterized protein n=1 Tax=Cichorium intybus TaxID=13427 RepID=A0ACB9H764_CICIN|nr:hypothetical protein L2E82_05464 [Cichorium intybus]